MCIVDSKENYNFDVGVKGLTNVICTLTLTNDYLILVIHRTLHTAIINRSFFSLCKYNNVITIQNHIYQP